MHRYAWHLFAITTFGRSQDAQGLGPFNVWNRVWSISTIAALRFFLQCFQNFPQPHVDAAFDLAHYQHRIDRLANVMRNPNSFDYHNAGIGIDIDLRHGCGITVSRRWSNAGALKLTG